MRTLYAADIRDNQWWTASFLIASKQHDIARNGRGNLTLKLVDRSGEIEA